ncbi:hypothetical protein C8J56DRAFT_163281 [Mycena floridula]|nr:hypothetical protein C8J56DRAFT_163281 [Mycena floridula]
MRRRLLSVAGMPEYRADTVPEGPLHLFLRDQGYDIIDGKFVRRERDHDDVIIGYNDVNQLFWYPEGIARFV